MSFKKNNGFTLIEVMITVAIVTILSATAVVNYYSFNDRLSLSSAGQEMALNIRQSQVYGLNVKEASVGGGIFTSGYGIYFNMDSGSNDNYIVFVDKDGDQKYDEDSGCGSGNTECVESVFLKNGVTISFIDSVESCPASNSARYLTITFLRPNPDADISFFNSGGNNKACSKMSSALITLNSRGGRSMILSVEKTGQIYTQES